MILQNKTFDLNPNDIAGLELVCQTLRNRILEVVSANGGHLSSSLGAVELIVGMHALFDCQKNPFIFDTSHQAYAHKLLTGRFESFSTLRQFQGLSGFTKPSESAYDYFIAGHSSTSVSIGVGVAKAFRLKQTLGMPIALLGDGSISAGIFYEALNELGDRKYPMIMILNDNEMSISTPIGALSKALSQLMKGPFYQSFRSKVKKILSTLPESVNYLASRFEESFKLITPGVFFEELGINYIGPINGHDLSTIIETLKLAKELKEPVLIHAQTLKGKGYKIAEGRYEKWHGVGPFDLDTGLSKKSKSAILSPTEAYSNTLLELAKKDEKIVGVTAAMPSGTGLDKLIDAYPLRFFDVAIAEQHALTSSSAMAKEGFKPFVSIYSTFLQRAYDSIVHDACISSLPIKLAIDRAGIVGEDGETHQGLLDVSYLRSIPNMVIFAPRDNETLKNAVYFANEYDSSPCAFRYPRGSFALKEGVFEPSGFVLGQSELLKKEGEILLIGYGNGVGRAHLVQLALKEKNIECALLDLRFLKPLDQNLSAIIAPYQKLYVFSDNYKLGGVASAILEFLSEQNILKPVKSFEITDEFIMHGNTALVEKSLGLDTESLTDAILKDLGQER